MLTPTLSQLINLNGKTAVVTGGALGIGQGIALRLAEAGAAVVVADINKTAADETVKQILACGGKATALIVDASSVADAERTAQFAVDTYGSLDILVNNAAIFPPSPVMDLSEALWDKVIDLNLKGTFFYSQAAAKRMIASGKGGRIVNIASVDALFPTGNLTHYDSSKGGVVMMTKSLAKELGVHKILVNVVAPGGVDTPGAREIMAAMNIPEGSMGPARAVLGRMAVADDIAKAAFFLASEFNTYLTGSLVVVDGGYLLM